MTLSKRLFLPVGVLTLVVSGRGLIGATPSDQQTPDHTAWVGTVLERMLAIKPGMTRADVLKVFTIEGGLSTGLERTFVSRDCRYFKVRVIFKAVGRPDRDANGRVTLVEDPRDTIVTISQPFLQFPIMN